MLKINSDFSSSLTMKGSGKVTIKSIIEISGNNSPLEIEHTADFNKIPVEMHKLYLEVFKSSVMDRKIYDNSKDLYPLSIKEKQKDWRLNRIVEIVSNIFK